MIVIDLLIVVVMALVVAFAITQLIVPVASGTPVLPSFRKPHARLESELEHAVEDLQDAETEAKIVSISERAAKIRNKEKSA